MTMLVSPNNAKGESLGDGATTDEAGRYYITTELGIQVFTEEDADRFSFDILDATKLIPEEMIPVRPIGRLTLNRNPDNFFAETEQVAFCTAHIVPGLDFSNDPLLAGRIQKRMAVRR